ncbi:hypothetical protein GHT06_006612 [Daphnia sinensis]|uniref:Uncharacterized protein n=1 Tax=Daphnia sinensis TaxID=1820382 RepID=A0AAD5PL69_9CRUS|nr:hypothetical protein GHT06_006642 [Daphnia sinensis]KAI9549313.1 hypothetical protein GHT06_006612 [Daphnia sinensis]
MPLGKGTICQVNACPPSTLWPSNLASTATPSAARWPILGQRGLVRSTQGRGTFVEAFAVDLALGKRTRHRQGLAQAGVRGGLQIIQSETVQANADQAQALDVPLGALCFICTYLAKVQASRCM